MTAPTLHEVARALGGDVSGGQVLAPGPGHSAKDRSLAVKISKTAADGFVVHSFSGDDPIVCRDHVRERLGLPRFKSNGHRTESYRTTVYEYRNPVTGKVRYRKERIDRADGSKTFIITPKGRGGSAPLLYGGEHLADLAEGQPVWVVEGEKKGERLRTLGAVAVCCDSGADSKWRPEHAELLRGLRVILWPDSDAAGEDYIASAAAAIRAEDPCADLRVVRPFGLPNGSKGRDVCNWKGDAEALARLADSAETYEPKDGPRPMHGDINVTLDDFYAYMPAHNYIFTPTREMWPAASVNARLPPLREEKPIQASAWLDCNKPVEQMTWAPGEPMLIQGRLVSDGGWIERRGVACFNLYRPPVIEPGDADKAGPWLEHTNSVFGDTAGHIVNWLAHRVQRPQEKINHALVLGGNQGIGKDTLLEPVKRAIGPWNFAEVSPQQMLGRFNGFLKSVILRLSEARDLGAI